MASRDSTGHAQGLAVMDAIKMCFKEAAEGSSETLATTVTEYMGHVGHEGTLNTAILELKDGNSKNLLHVACQSGNVSVVDFLVDSVPGLVSVETNDNFLPLRYAVSIQKHKSRKRIVSKLLDVYPDAIKGGATHAACYEGHVDVIETFCEKHTEYFKAALDEVLPSMGSPVQCAVMSSNKSKIMSTIMPHIPAQALVDDGVAGIPCVLLLAAADRNGDCLDVVLGHEALEDSHLISAKDPHGYNLLHTLVESGHEEQVKFVKTKFSEAYNYMIQCAVGADTVLSLASTKEIEAIIRADFDETKVVKVTTKVAEPVKKSDEVDTEEEDVEKRMKEELKKVFAGEPTTPVSTEVLDQLTKLKLEANELVRLQSWASAIKCYEEGLAICPANSNTQEWRSQVYANMSMCHVKINSVKEAQTCARMAIALNDNWWKPYLRLAIALADAKDYAEACQQIYKGMLTSPENKTKAMLKQYLDLYVLEARKAL